MVEATFIHIACDVLTLFAFYFSKSSLWCEDLGYLPGDGGIDVGVFGCLNIAQHSSAACSDVQWRLVHRLWGLLASKWRSTSVIMEELGDGLPSWNLISFVGQFSFGRRSSMPNDSHRRSHPCFHLGAWFYSKSWNLVGVLFETQEIYGDIFQGQADGETFFFFLRDTKRWRVEENSIIMPDVPNFAKQHFEHFQRSNGHRSTGETLLYQAGSSRKTGISGKQRTSKQTFKCQISKILQRRNNSPAENHDMIDSKTKLISLSQVEMQKSSNQFSFEGFFFMSFLCEALALYLIPCHEILHIVQHLHLGPWPMDDGMFLKLVLVRCGITVPALCSR